MNDNVVSNAATKVTPIDEFARQRGAQFASRAGWRLADVYDTVAAEETIARQGVALVDCSANGKILVEGGPAEAVMAAAWSAPALAIGAGAAAGPGHLFRLRTDLFFASTPPGAESEAVAALQAAAGQLDDLVTVTDVSHGRAELWLVGPESATLLSRLCGLDLHHDAFPALAARQSGVAKTSQLILRRPLGEVEALALIGDRSLGAYLWHTILEAGADLGLAPIGLSAFERLAQEEE